ncbi:MAG: MFS transporter, partial [Kiloniellales bacterium]|nr:MFS transporter [Kiloniellales bacterium]
VLVALTDRVDPRRVYAFSALLAVASSVGFGWLAEGFWTATLFRALAGFGLAGTYMPGLKALTDHIGPAQQSRGVAFYTASFSIGSSLSFFLAGEIDAWLGWRWAFVLSGVGPALALGLVWGLVPATGPHQLETPSRFLLDFRPVLVNRRAMAYVLAYCAHNWELFALRSWLVAFLVFAQAQHEAGAPGALWSATVVAAVVNLVGLPSSVLANELTRRFGRRGVVVAVMSSSALLASLLGFLTGLPIPLLVAICFIYGVTVTADSASITAGVVAHAAPGARGATMAVHSFIGFAGAFVGPIVFGGVLDLAGGGAVPLSWGLAFLSSGLAVALGPVAVLVLGRRSAQPS